MIVIARPPLHPPLIVAVGGPSPLPSPDRHDTPDQRHEGIGQATSVTPLLPPCRGIVTCRADSGDVVKRREPHALISLFLSLSVLITACGSEQERGFPSEANPSNAAGGTTTPPSSEAMQRFICGESLALFPTTVPGIPADEVTPDGRPGPGPESLAVEDGQLVAHWEGDFGVMIEMRWPGTRHVEDLGAGETFEVAGHPAYLAPHSPGPEEGRHVVQVSLSDPPDPCALLSVDAYGPIPDAARDAARAFAEGLRPRRELDEYRADLQGSREPSPSVPCRGGEVTQPPDTALTFYALCNGAAGLAPYPVYRPGRTSPSLEASIQALVAGTTPEERAFGLSTGFDRVEESDHIEVIAELDPAGIAQLDFLVGGERWNPGSRASASAQLLSFIDPLEATVFLHPGVSGLDRSTLCWGEWDCEGIATKEQWEARVFVNAGVLTHAGCSPEGSWRYPDRCSLEGILAHPTLEATVTNVAADDVLNLRAGPGTEYFRIGELEPGGRVEATREVAVAADGGIWRLVRPGSGEAGWVNQAFLDIRRTSEQALVDAFVAFAKGPGDDTFAALPLADHVAFGLGPEILATTPASRLRQPSAWELDAEGFRAYVGPFSALDLLGPLGAYDVTLGPHPHCASPPMPPPEGMEDLERISVQPRLGFEDSCLAWFSVDFFVAPDGRVQAITLDLWEP